MKNCKAVFTALLLICASWAVANHHEAGELESALTDSSRADADKARDAGRMPAHVLTYLGIGSGMTVMDVIAAGGYYTEVLSIAVGAGRSRVRAESGSGTEVP